jgi:hypothetical protein
MMRRAVALVKQAGRDADPKAVPVLKAAWHTGTRAASHALSWARIVLRAAAGALEYLANCATSIWESTFSALVW